MYWTVCFKMVGMVSCMLCVFDHHKIITMIIIITANICALPVPSASCALSIWSSKRLFKELLVLFSLGWFGSPSPTKIKWLPGTNKVTSPVGSHRTDKW